MNKQDQFYINGQWVPPHGNKTLELISPTTATTLGTLRLGNEQDVDLAVKAARAAFNTYSRTSVAERIELLEAILNKYEEKKEELAQAVSAEMGAPLWLARAAQVPMGAAHIKQAIRILKNFEFQTVNRGTAICYEPIGVVGMITPWNWPLNQVLCKVAPALAAGCSVILKPSEQAALSAILLADIMHDAGVPAGVFNLINGQGDPVGKALASHPDIDMISFTGSTAAGIAVATYAAPSVKRVAQELGGKSANIILRDADLPSVLKQSLQACFLNSGQSCNAPTRLLIPREQQEQAIQILHAQAVSIEQASLSPDDKKRLGPVVNQTQFDRIQALIQAGITEGARLVSGGLGKPEGITEGYFVRPTIFADVQNSMRIAQEEIFGPVLCLIPYDSEQEAIDYANDSEYGLAGYIYSKDMNKARAIAAQLRTGMVHINGAGPDVSAPFGGYKRSGNGREWGEFGFKEYLEVKAIMGYEQQ